MTQLWTPSSQRITQSNMFHFMHHVQQPTYSALYQWSIEKPAKFWRAVWEFCHIKASRQWDKVFIPGKNMWEAQWFQGAQLNFAENLLSRNDDKIALIYRCETGERRTLSYAQLYRAVLHCANLLQSLGVTVNDRIAGIMPNTPEAVIAMLATTSLGAIWSSCSPDFGASAIIDRFSQIRPKVLFVAQKHHYNGKRFDDNEKISAIHTQLPSVEKVLFTETLLNPEKISETAISFAQLPFNHPAAILYSSGTTGMPKCIVHGAGGTLLQHLKELVLHTDVKEKDVIFYYTTCGWMMWNWLVSSLATGATVVLYDGSPLYPAAIQLFDIIDEEHITIFGTSSKFLSAIEKTKLKPVKTHHLDSLKTLLSTGSPLLPQQFDFVYHSIKKGVCLSSISGGTDIVSCFALGNPLLPVYRGELQCIGLGMKVEVFNEAGQSVKQQKGELVCTAPFPSMPVYFWDDPQKQKYQHAYFEKFPSIWAHGDYAEITQHQGMIIYGRSDSVLNPGGIRIGTAEIYREVEKIPDVLESIAVEQETGDDTRIILFVKLAQDKLLSETLKETIKKNIREHLSPHHVPRHIIQVPDIPRTINGKIVELAVRDIIHGRPIKNREAIINPDVLAFFIVPEN